MASDGTETLSEYFLSYFSRYRLCEGKVLDNPGQRPSYGETKSQSAFAAMTRRCASAADRIQFRAFPSVERNWLPFSVLRLG